MGCGNCGTGTQGGKPAGCKSNGGCSSGGCNRLNVFDWLNGLPLSDQSKPFQVIEISFNKGSRKDFYRNGTHQIFEKGDQVTLEGVGGFDVGEVSLTGELVKLQMKKYGVEDTPALKRILRSATEEDLVQYSYQKGREQDMMIQSRAIARHLQLEMKICEVEIQADGKKATFFYTADHRVDFRELIKRYASEFRLKVEMRQIGARQESGKVGGIGACGRELCCSTWLTDFKSVNTSAARYQNLSINQTKLSGQCGRLKCCLNYELDTYMDALRVFPEKADTIQMAKGNAYLQKRDIFRSLMWYSYPDSNKQYPLTIPRVREILDLNRQGVRPDELGSVELEVASADKPEVKSDVGFVNDVGQISLKSLERSGKKRKSKGGGKRPGGGGGGAVQVQAQPNTQERSRAPKDRKPGAPGPQQRRQGAEGKPAEGRQGEAKRPPRNNEQRPRPPQRKHPQPGKKPAGDNTGGPQQS